MRHIFLCRMAITASVFCISLSSFGATFRVRPYLHLTKEQKIRVSWAYGRQYDPLAEFGVIEESAALDMDRDLIALKLFKGGKLVKEMDSVRSDDLESVQLPIDSCEFGSDLSYQVRGMIAPAPITDVPCANAERTRFTFIADTQEGPELSRRFTEEMQRFPGSFILHGGDMVQTGGDEYDWTRYFWAMEPVAGTRLTVPAVGNHEYRDDDHALLWSKYYEMPAEEAFYVFDSGPVRMIVLSSNFEDDSMLIKKQIEFVERELAMPAQWKIVVFHHPPYSWSIAQIDAPFTRKEHLALRKYFVPLFERYKVDLVLNGHTHLFEYSLKDDVHYLTTGAAGGKMGVHNLKQNNPYTRKSEKVRTMIHLEATPTALQALTQDIDGKALGTLTLRKHGRGGIEWLH